MEENKIPEDLDHSLDALRQRARANAEDTTPGENELVLPKEMKGRPVWIVRSLIVLSLMLVAVEAYIFMQNRTAFDVMKYEAVPAAVLSEPAEAPLPTPTDILPPPPEFEVESLPTEPILTPPAPDEIPLPEGVEEIPFPNTD